jgi:hypothetical protein
MSSVTSSVDPAEFGETPRHLEETYYDERQDANHTAGLFGDDDSSNGIPPPSPASPTRHDRTAAAQPASLTRETPLDQGMYVSEPHFAPPRMDESTNAWFSRDDFTKKQRDEWDAALFTKSLAVSPSVSSHKNNSPAVVTNGFVPKPAERRAAAIALERDRAVTETVEEEIAEQEEAAEQEETAVLEETEELEEIAVQEETFEEEEQEREILSPEAVVDSTAPVAPMDRTQQSIHSVRSSVRSVGTAHDEEVAVTDGDEDDDGDGEFDENEITHPRPDFNVDDPVMAALMAEAMRDAARSREDAATLFAEATLSAEEEARASAEEGMERIRNGASAVRRARYAARVSTELSASTSLRNSYSRDENGSGLSSRVSSVQSSPARVSRPTSTRSSVGQLLPVVTSRSSSHSSTRHDHLQTSLREATDLRVSVESLRASLGDGLFFSNETAEPESEASSARASQIKSALSPIKTDSPSRSSLRSPQRLSHDNSLPGTLPSPPQRSPNRESEVRFQDTLEPLDVRATEETESLKEETRLVASRASVSSKSRTAYAVPEMTPRAVSARNAMDARRVAAETEKAAAAAAFQRRRKEAGKEALLRFFGAKKEKSLVETQKVVRNASNARTPLRLRHKINGDEREDGEKVVEKRTDDTSLTLEREKRELPLPKVALLRPGQRQHGALGATAAAAQSSTRAVFEAARFTASAAREETAGELLPPETTTNIPRVAGLDAQGSAHARDILHAVAAAQRAVDSISKASRAAAAYASVKETIAATSSGDAQNMPSRNVSRAPLPKVSLFEPTQRGHVTRAEMEAAVAERERAEQEALNSIKARAAAARAEAAAAKAALDAEKAEAAAVEFANGRYQNNHKSVEEMYPSWFGVVGDNNGDGVITTHVVPGFTTGAGSFIREADGERESDGDMDGDGDMEGDGEREADGERSPSSSSKQNARSVSANSRDDFFASPRPLFGLTTPKPTPPPPLPLPSSREARESDREPWPDAFPESEKAHQKGESFFVDVTGWSDARHAGVPSGAWGDFGDNHKKKTGISVPPTPEAEIKSLASVAAGRRNVTSARGNRVGAVSRAQTSRQTPSTILAYKPSAKLSNKKLVKNALAHVCLAGAAMRVQREHCLDALESVDDTVAQVFVIAFRENVAPHRFRALYALCAFEFDEKTHGEDASSRKHGERLVKIHGVGPTRVSLADVECTMKYDSGTREFKPLATSAVGPQTAAVTLAKR